MAVAVLPLPAENAAECELHLPEALRRTRTVVLTDWHWIAICTLAGIRLASNDGIRRSNRSRGDANNITNDIQGSAGEIASLDMLESLATVARIEYTAFYPGGSVDDVDFRVYPKKGESFGLETKTLLHDPKKRLLPINKAAHEKSGERNSCGYLPVISAAGSTRAEIGRVIRNSEVESWKEVDFGYKDPAFIESISTISAEFFEMPEATLWASVNSRRSILTEEQCIMLCREARKYPHDRVIENLPIRTLFSVLKRTRAGQAVWALAAELGILQR